MKIKKYKDLNAWQESHRVAVNTYRITSNFPASEKFSLVNQMRRASVSVTSNIAEGFGRATKKDKQHFFAMAKGSLLEIESQYALAKDVGYVEDEEFRAVSVDIQLALRLISGLINGAKNRPKY